MKQKDEDLLVLENQVEESKNRYETQINELKIKSHRLIKSKPRFSLTVKSNATMVKSLMP